jgi:lipopolysaccharide biosynthesis glycosyltransferase
VLSYTKATELDRAELLMGVNFARNFLDDLLLPHGVQRAVYLDVDTIVQADLAALGDTIFEEGKFFAAVRVC